MLNGRRALNLRGRSRSRANSHGKTRCALVRCVLPHARLELLVYSSRGGGLKAFEKNGALALGCIFLGPMRRSGVHQRNAKFRIIARTRRALSTFSVISCAALALARVAAA